MARMPGATWIGPTPNRDANAMGAIHGLVLHVQQGTEAGSEAWLKNPQSQASAHFLNPKLGGLRQLVDTADKAWAQAKGNPNWISVENEGLSGQALTASQIENCAELLAWLHETYNVPLAVTDNPDGNGLIWHGAGGSAWGGHPDCPGAPIVAQRAQIVAYAQRLLAQPVSHAATGTDQEDDVTVLIQATSAAGGISKGYTATLSAAGKRHIGPSELEAWQPVIKAGLAKLVQLPGAQVAAFPDAK